MIITQALITLFIIFAISRVVLRFKEGKISLVALIGWFLLWSWVELVIWIPGITTDIANILGIGRGADLIIYSSIVVLFYLIFRMYVKLEDTEREITELVRKIALNEKDKFRKPKASK